MARGRVLELQIVSDVSKATAGIQKVEKDVSGLSKIGKLAGGLFVAGAAIQGIEAVVGGLDALTKSAREDAASQKQLASALKQVGLEKYTKEAEKAAAAAIDLGFADEEYRNALQQSVRITEDFALSQQVMAAAMDLSRAKQIPLEQATLVVTKAVEGQTGALRKMGIDLDKSATSTEVLTALTAKYGDAAESAADTSEGRWAALQLKLGEVGEEIGSRLLPVFEALLGFVLTNVLPVISKLVKVFFRVVDAVAKALQPALDELMPALDELFTVLSPLIDVLLKVLGAVLKIVGPLVLKAFVGLIQSLVAGVKAVAAGISWLVKTLGDLVRWFQNAVKAAGDFLDSINPLKNFKLPELPFLNTTAAGRAAGVAARAGGARAGGATAATINIYTTGDSLAVERAVVQALTRVQRRNAGLPTPVRFTGST